MEDSNTTTIKISKQNHARLDALGKRGESYNKILSRVLDIFEIKRADKIIGVKNGTNNNWKGS